jgi:hypothetical protein
MAERDRRRTQFAEVRSFVGAVYGTDLHAKRIDSLAGATLGVTVLRSTRRLGMLKPWIAAGLGRPAARGNTPSTQTSACGPSGDWRSC